MPRRRAASSAEEDSGAPQPAGKNMFMFLDGNVPAQLTDSLVVQRDPWNATEVQEMVQSLPKLPVTFGMDCPDEIEKLAAMHSCLASECVVHGALSWHILFDKRAWALTEPLETRNIINATHFATARVCATCVVTRIDSDVEQLTVRVVLLKVHRGKAQCLEWFIDQEVRRRISEYIGQLLQATDLPLLIVGDMGMRAAYLMGQDLGHNETALIYSEKRDAQMAVSTSCPGWIQNIRDWAQSAHTLLFEYEMESTDAPTKHFEKKRKHEKDELEAQLVPAKHESVKQICLQSRAQKVLQMLESEDGMTDITCINALWHPIQFPVQDLSGEVTLRPRNIKDIVKCFGDALELITAARREGRRAMRGFTGATQPGEEPDAETERLSKEEFKVALTFLQKQFHECFMENQELKLWYTWLQDMHWNLSSKDKEWTRKNFRSAFRNWVTKILGNYNFAMVILEHGILEPAERRKFVEALVRMKDEPRVDLHHADEAERRRLRNAALKARLTWRHCNKLYEWLQKDRTRYDCLTCEDKLLMRKYDSGELLQARRDADEAYGHGREVEIMTVRERAMLRAWSSDI